MSIAKKHLNHHAKEVRFETNTLADILQEGLPDVEFCLLPGSARDGIVRKNADLDLAFYLNRKIDYAFYNTVYELVDRVVPNVLCDIGILNHAEPVFCFEALKGRLLFVKDMEKYLRFYSLTCREYESQMASYRRQLQYRRKFAYAL